MAGYLFAMGSKEAAMKCMKTGIYSTYVKPTWDSANYATFGDYLTMKDGDNVYFFAERMIYGIGEIINFNDSITAINNYSSSGDKPLIRSIPMEGKIQKWIIRFQPSPHLFMQEIDMDALLESNPEAFRSLRVFSQRSFIEFDDVENQAFKTGILQKNLSTEALNTTGRPLDVEDVSASNIEKNTAQLTRYGNTYSNRRITTKPLLALKRKKNGPSSVEMLIEDGLLKQLNNHEPTTEQVFGEWDYLAHQVAASPMKPVAYMDFIDVFGYKWIRDIDDRIVDEYLVIEIKKDSSDGLSPDGGVNQLMKYVDWVCEHYAGGNYAQIKAFLVAHDFTHEPNMQSNAAVRNYISGHRPAQTKVWNDLILVRTILIQTGHYDSRPMRPPRK